MGDMTHERYYVDYVCTNCGARFTISITKGQRAPTFARCTTCGTDDTTKLGGGRTCNRNDYSEFLR